MENPKAQIGLYSFLGNDYTPAFYGKVKVRPINLALKDAKFVKVFGSLGSIPLEQQMFEEIERYVCIMYGFIRTCKNNDVIKSMFEEKSKPTISTCPLENIKSIDPTMFPPCKVLLEQQTKRAWFIAHLYKTAVETYPAINHTPIDFGLEPDESHEYLQVTKFHHSQSLLIRILTQKKVRMKQTGTVIKIMVSAVTTKMNLCKM